MTDTTGANLRDQVGDALDEFQLRMRSIRNGERTVQEIEREANRIIALLREDMLADDAVEAALIQFMADSSFIAAPAARQWWNRLKDEPEHGEDFSDSKYLYREAMRSGMIAALALDAITNGGEDER